MKPREAASSLLPAVVFFGGPHPGPLQGEGAYEMTSGFALWERQGAESH